MFAVLRRRWLRIPTKESSLLGRHFVDSRFAVFAKLFSSETTPPGVCGNDSERSITVSYLINSCGLSSKDALIASQNFQIRSPKKSDGVLELLRSYEFTNAQIQRIVNRWPRVLAARPKARLLPKLEFFRSIGVPPGDLARQLSFYPTILQRSLEHYLIPGYKFMKSIIKSDKQVVRVFRRAPRAFADGWNREIKANIDLLRELGVAESTIALLLTHHPSFLLSNKGKITPYADQATEMGFDVKKVTFVHALLVLVEISESALKQKMDVYRRCGWSNSDISTAFLKHPLCMKFSEEKIMACMDFFVNKIGFEPGAIAQRPLLLGFSLEKRIKPRCWVVGFLKAKGLLKSKMRMINILTISEKNFVKWFIVDHMDDCPSLSDMYLGKLRLHGVAVDQD